MRSDQSCYAGSTSSHSYHRLVGTKYVTQRRLDRKFVRPTDNFREVRTRIAFRCACLPCVRWGEGEGERGKGRSAGEGEGEEKEKGRGRGNGRKGARRGRGVGRGSGKEEGKRKGEEEGKGERRGNGKGKRKGKGRERERKGKGGGLRTFRKCFEYCWNTGLSAKWCRWPCSSRRWWLK